MLKIIKLVIRYLLNAISNGSNEVKVNSFKNKENNFVYNSKVKRLNKVKYRNAKAVPGRNM